MTEQSKHSTLLLIHILAQVSTVNKLPVQKKHLSTNSNVALISPHIILHLQLKGGTIVQKASEQHSGRKSSLTTVFNCICAPPYRKKVVPPSQVFTQVWLCNRFN